jgi:SAM-dependent methyltransferase
LRRLLERGHGHRTVAMIYQMRPLGEGWNSHADQWITWARVPGLDTYWAFHREAFLPLVPRPGRLTVDIGCGEGRVSRDLRALGHQVVAADLSFAMSRAVGTHPTDPVPVVVADAAQLPLATGSADCAVAFMSLHDIDHMPAAVNEIARVLAVGGHLVMAIVHPINSAGQFTGERADASRPFVIDGSYLEPRRYVDTVTRHGMNVTFCGEHRPLQDYTDALADAGFVIARLREPTDPDPSGPWRRVPMFLNIVAVLQQHARG